MQLALTTTPTMDQLAIYTLALQLIHDLDHALLRLLPCLKPLGNDLCSIVLLLLVILRLFWQLRLFRLAYGLVGNANLASIRLAIRLAIRMTIPLAIRLTIRLAIRLTIRITIPLAIRLTIRLAIRLTIRLTI
jgi:hypothetical protein